MICRESERAPIAYDMNGKWQFLPIFVHVLRNILRERHVNFHASHERCQVGKQRLDKSALAMAHH